LQTSQINLHDLKNHLKKKATHDTHA